jgi:hypothetical protein
MSIVLLGSTSGSVTLQEPAVAGTTVIDLPATSGTMAVTSGSPSFANITATGTLAVNGNTTLGDATTDTLTVGVTGIVKDSSGNVGIGTASPLTRLQVLSSGTDNTAGDSISSAVASFTGPNYAIGAASNPANLQVMSNSTLGADVGASIGFGGRYSTTQFAQFAVIKGAKENATTGQYGTYLAFGTRANSTDISERMRIDSAGNVLVGTTSVYSAPKMAVAFTSAVNNGLVFYQTNNSTGTFINFFSNSTTQQGSIINNNNGTVNYANASDYRLKENIVDFDENGLNLINNVKVRKFNRKEYPDATITGFIAHELAEVCPQAVCGEKDAVNEDGSIKAQSVDQSYLVPFLVKAIQEMKAIIDTQASTITQLQADVAALKGA